MSVPTKTGLEIMKSCLVREREDGLQYIPDDIHLKYILLEDHQKEIELAVKKRFDLVEAYEKQIKREGWLSPEQLKEKIEKFIQIINIENGFEDPQSITGHRAVLVLTIRERLRNEFNKFFGVGGAK